MTTYWLRCDCGSESEHESDELRAEVRVLAAKLRGEKPS
jgi:hypothetical protein